MKTMKSIYSLAFALAVVLAATGCRHETGRLTNLPGPKPAPIGDEGINTKGIDMTGGGYAETSREEINGMIADRTTLAGDTIHFAYDSSAIRKGEQANLQAVAQMLSSDHNLKVMIEGNCDERGTEEYNRALGQRRASAAREALIKMGIDPMRIATKSFGKDNPLNNPGHDEAAWAQNRRDDFVLLHPKTGA